LGRKGKHSRKSTLAAKSRSCAVRVRRGPYGYVRGKEGKCRRTVDTRKGRDWGGNRWEGMRSATDTPPIHCFVGRDSKKGVKKTAGVGGADEISPAIQQNREGNQLGSGGKKVTDEKLGRFLKRVPAARSSKSFIAPTSQTTRRMVRRRKLTVDSELNHYHKYRQRQDSRREERDNGEKLQKGRPM